MELIEFAVGDYDLSFFLTKEKRKSITMKIQPPLWELFVKCPEQATIEEIKRFIEKNIKGIKQYREKHKNDLESCQKELEKLKN